MKTLIFIGAGSTADIGIRISDKQTEIIKEIPKLRRMNSSYFDNNDYELLERFYYIINDLFDDNFSMNDLYNLLDDALILNTGIYSKNRIIEKYEVSRCKNLLINLIFNDFKEKVRSRNPEKYNKLVYFYKRLAEIEIEKKLNSNLDPTSRDFFICDYSIINLNFDLFSICPIIEAHTKVNNSAGNYLFDGNSAKLKIFTNFGCEHASMDDNKNPWYPTTEPLAFKMNNSQYNSNRRILILNALFPHGLVNLFRCPNCSRHSIYIGNTKIDNINEKLGKNIIYNCPYCNTEITNHDVDVLIQSNFKRPTPYLKELALKERSMLRAADRIIFIGYSLPPDDVDNRTMFKSICKGKEIYVVNYNPCCIDRNYFDDCKDLKEIDSTVNRFTEIFKTAKFVKFNLAGFPDATESILDLFRDSN